MKEIGSGNIRYNEENDKIQVYYESEWYNVIKAGLQSIQLTNTESSDWSTTKNVGVSNVSYSIFNGVISFSSIQNNQNYTVGVQAFLEYNNLINIKDKTLYVKGTAGGSNTAVRYTYIQYSTDKINWIEIYGVKGVTINISYSLNSLEVEQSIYIRVGIHTDGAGTLSNTLSLTDFRIE